MVYSLGPDMADESGRITYDPTNGIRSAGDIALDEPPAPPQSRTEDALPAAPIRNPIPPTAPSPAQVPSASDEDIMAAFAALKEKTKRDNSLAYYFEARRLPVDWKLTMKQIREAPANEEIAAKQKVIFAQCQPAFALLRKGAELDSAEWPPLPGDWQTPPMPGIPLANAMIGEGNAFLRTGEVDKALANYRVTVVVGDHYRSRGAPQMYYLVGTTWMQTCGVNALGDLAKSGRLSEAQLSTVSQLFARMDRAEGGMAAVKTRFFDARLPKLEAALREKRLIEFMAEPHGDDWRFSDDELRDLNTLQAHPDAVLAYARESKSLGDARLAMPYYQREPLDWQARVRQAEIDSGLPLRRLQDFVGEYADIRVDLINLAELRNLRVIIAAERFKLKVGDYPSRAGDLVPAYLDRMPNDPFTGKPLH